MKCLNRAFSNSGTKWFVIVILMMFTLFSVFHTTNVVAQKQKKANIKVFKNPKEVTFDIPFPNVADYFGTGNLGNEEQTEAIMMFLNVINEPDPKKQIELYSNTIEKYPTLQAYNSRAIVYIVMGDYGKAMDDMNEMVRLFPQKESYFNRASINLLLNNYNDAVADFSEAIKCDSLDADIYYKRGMIYFEQADMKRANSDFSELIRLDPDNAAAYLVRATTFEFMDDYAMAENDYNKAVTLNPKDPELYSYRADFYSKMADKYPEKRGIYMSKRKADLDKAKKFERFGN